MSKSVVHIDENDELCKLFQNLLRIYEKIPCGTFSRITVCHSGYLVHNRSEMFCIW
jgi:hypothetical protein